MRLRSGAVPQRAGHQHAEPPRECVKRDCALGKAPFAALRMLPRLLPISPCCGRVLRLLCLFRSTQTASPSRAKPVPSASGILESGHSVQRQPRTRRFAPAIRALVMQERPPAGNLPRGATLGALAQRSHRSSGRQQQRQSSVPSAVRPEWGAVACAGSCAAVRRGSLQELSIAIHCRECLPQHS